MIQSINRRFKFYLWIEIFMPDCKWFKMSKLHCELMMNLFETEQFIMESYSINAIAGISTCKVTALRLAVWWVSDKQLSDTQKGNYQSQCLIRSAFSRWWCNVGNLPAAKDLTSLSTPITVSVLNKSMVSICDFTIMAIYVESKAIPFIIIRLPEIRWRP